MTTHNAQTVMMSRVEVLACATELQRREEPEDCEPESVEVSSSREPVREALLGIAIGAAGLSALVMLFGTAVMVSAVFTLLQ